jgi:hypothetical protein
MLEKLFARLRSWRQGDVVQHLAVQAATPMLPTSARAGGLATLAGPMTPPPLPADAWAESESGIVITDSGIIILGPTAEPIAPPAAGASPPVPPAEPAPAKRKLTPGELDWDDVLARARARAEEAEGQAPPSRPATAKGKQAK